MPIDASVGRRSKSKAERRGKFFPGFRCTDEEFAALNKAVDKSGVPSSSWAREKLLAAAGQGEDPVAELRQLKARMEKLLRG